jgi:mannosylglycerate hydrolase
MQTLPTQHFVDLSKDGHGLAVLHTGMTEYEACDDENSTLLMTLFRAMGNMIVTWWEAVGVFPDQDGSQLQRKMTFDYALYPHDGAWADAEVYAEAEALNVPLAPFQLTSNGQGGELPSESSLYAVEPANLVVSALKQAQDLDSCILRVFNPTNETIEGRIRSSRRGSPLLRQRRRPSLGCCGIRGITRQWWASGTWGSRWTCRKSAPNSTSRSR